MKAGTGCTKQTFVKTNARLEMKEDARRIEEGNVKGKIRRLKLLTNEQWN